MPCCRLPRQSEGGDCDGKCARKTESLDPEFRLHKLREAGPGDWPFERVLVSPPLTLAPKTAGRPAFQEPLEECSDPGRHPRLESLHAFQPAVCSPPVLRFRVSATH